MGLVTAKELMRDALAGDVFLIKNAEYPDVEYEVIKIDEDTGCARALFEEKEVWVADPLSGWDENRRWLVLAHVQSDLFDQDLNGYLNGS